MTTVCRSVFLAFAATTILTGCFATPTAQIAAGALGTHYLFKDEDVNFTERNYAVADYLHQQAESFLRRGTLIKAVPLTDSDMPNLTSDFAKMIPEEVGLRLMQLGHRVDVSDVTTTEDLNNTAKNTAANKNPDFILSGNYKRARHDLDIIMKITNVRDGRIIALIRYTMPLNKAVREASKVEPQIIRLPE